LEAVPQRLPAAVPVCELDSVEAVCVAVALSAAGVPALGSRDRRPGPMAPRQVEGSGHARAAQDAPGVAGERQLEHGHSHALARLESRCDLAVSRLLPRLRELVVEMTLGGAGKRGEPDLEPLVGAVRPETFAADADPRGDVA